MEVWFLLAAAAVVFVALITRERWLPAPASATGPSLPVLQDTPECARCRFFGLEAGQRLMRSHGAFHAAAQTLAPWQMSASPTVTPNPEYVALEQALKAATEAGDVEQSQELQARLLEVDPGTREDPEVDPELVSLSWEDFGLCAKHKELRARTDGCDAFEVRT